MNENEIVLPATPSGEIPVEGETTVDLTPLSQPSRKQPTVSHGRQTNDLEVVNQILDLQSQRISQLADLLENDRDALRNLLQVVVTLGNNVQRLGHELQESMSRLENATAALIYLAEDAQAASTPNE